MPTLLLATYAQRPEGETEGESLVEACARHGVDARWVAWDDPTADWGAADAVAVRSTWDYHTRLSEFLAWAQRIERTTRLLNGADVFAWNSDKAYLLDLSEDGVPSVPTARLDGPNPRALLDQALDRWGAVVVKPRVGASGQGVTALTSLCETRHGSWADGGWLAQPLVESVRTTGESSIFVFAGRPVSQVDKRAAAGEIRVHAGYGGTSRAVTLDPERADVATRVVRAVAERMAHALDYARVDLMWHDDHWCVSEVELIEPGLYLDIVPGNAQNFADAAATLLGCGQY